MSAVSVSVSLAGLEPRQPAQTTPLMRQAQGEPVRLQVLRSLLAPTSSGAGEELTSPVPLLGRVLEASAQGLAVGTLVLAAGELAPECWVPAVTCLPLTAGTDQRLALLAGAASPLLAALRRVGLEIGMQAVVLGLNWTGLMLVSLCRLAGAGTIAAVDARAPRRTHAQRLGAARVASSQDLAWPETLLHGSSRGGADVVFVTATEPDQVAPLLGHCRKEARILLLAPTLTSPIDLYHAVHVPGRILLGPEPTQAWAAWTPWATDAARLLRLLQAGRFCPKGLLGESINLAEISAQRARLLDPTFTGAPTAVIDWETRPNSG